MDWFALQREKKEKRELEELLEELGIKRSSIAPKFDVKVYHEAIKEVAEDFLREQGFEDREIKHEYTVKTTEGKGRWRVDVVGIKKGYKVAVECGKYDARKILDLMKIFDEVYLLDIKAEAICVGPDLLRVFVEWLKRRV